MKRNDLDLLTGDLQYSGSFTATVDDTIPPVLYPCESCGELTLHLTCRQPTGLALKLPFSRKPLASTGFGYLLVCNECTTTSGISDTTFYPLLVRRIVPNEICSAIDRFLETDGDAPRAYTEGFIKWVNDRSEIESTALRALLAVYRREE